MHDDDVDRVIASLGDAMLDRRARRAVAVALAGAALGAGAYYACERAFNERFDANAKDDENGNENDDDDDDDDDATTRDARAGEPSTSTSRPPIDVKDTRDARRAYEALELAFATDGLDRGARAARKYFHFARHPEVGTWPKTYAEMGMPSDCARLVILTMEDAPAICAAAQRATREVTRLLGETMDAHAPGRGSLHVTLFHLSRTFEYVRAPVEFASAATLPPNAPNAREDAVAYEESAVAEALRGCGECELEVDRVCLAPSGCLILCFNDVHGCVQTIRERLARSAVGAARAQNDTVHCTLARLFAKSDGFQMDPERARAVQAMCATVTSALRGARFKARSATYCVERTFSHCDGRRARISLG